jgi:Amt family ammonium transporter
MLDAPETALRELRRPTKSPVPTTVLPLLDNRRILLVEDGPDNQLLINHVLRKAGAAVVTTANGREGLDAALAAYQSGEPFDLILMDIQMPVMDGYQAMRTLRAAGYTHPIIALTAHVMAADHEACRAAGADDVATKPIDRKQLVALAARYCRTRETPAITT